VNEVIWGDFGQPRVGGWVVFVFELQIVIFEGFLGSCNDAEHSQE